jgi:Fic family protein
MGHSEAFTLLYKLARKKTVSEKDILDLHHLFYYRIDETRAGKYRREKVIITGTNFVPPPPAQVPGLMKRFSADIPKMKKKYHPVEFAALLHEELVTIHPFTDGNGRAARLLMNLALLQAGYAITIIPPVLRSDYISALKKAQTGAKEDRPFLNFISCMVYESMKDHVRLLNAL